MFYVLQIVSRFAWYRNWQAELQVGWLNIALLLFCFLQTIFKVPRYTNWQTDSRNGELKIEYVLNMYGFLIPYLATFWIAGSRVGGLKIGPLLLCVLQIAPRVLRYTNWHADLQVGWLNIALLLFRVLQTTLGVPQYTNWEMDSRAGEVKIVIVYGWWFLSTI